jgi:tRNA 2-thiocytidine biosynthesis protein TtcA
MRLREAAPINFELSAVTVDPMWDSFNAAGSAEFCRSLGIEHTIIPLPMQQIIEEKGGEKSPCVLCSRLRRGLLYRFAADNNCNLLALGQHLDDIEISFFMSLCRGQGLKTMAPLVPGDPQSGKPTVIRPLAFAPESLIVECASSWDLPRAGICRYRDTLESGDRQYFKELLGALEERIPDIRSNIMHSLGKVEKEHLL